MHPISPNVYKHFNDQREHVLNVPDMYVGSTKLETTKEWVYREGRMLETKLEYIPAVERLYLEVLSNAGDNVIRSRRHGVETDQIVVAVKDNQIAVKNGGIPIPVAVQPEYGLYVPELIFGTMLSSSNYNVERYGAGVNGLGAKLCNIFSKWFVVDIGDSYNHLHYSQRWSDHMRDRHQPTIEPYDGDPYVVVAFEIDDAYFNWRITPEVTSLFARHAIDLSYNLDIQVVFNGEVFFFRDPMAYGRMYMGVTTVDSSCTQVNASSTHVDVGPTRVDSSSNHVDVRGTYVDIRVTSVDVGGRSRAIIFDTPDKGKVVSFVNGIPTKEGGVHVNAVYKALCDRLKPLFDGALRQPQLKLHVSLVLSIWIKNPRFTGQTKTHYSGPPIDVSVDDRCLNEIKQTWRLMERLRVESRMVLHKTDGKKVRFLSLRSLEDANKAGTYESGRCVLIYTEGNSASSYATKAISLLSNGRDYWGIYSARGKPLNVMNAKVEQELANNVFNELKQALGLRSDIDYLDDANFSTLRYGRLLIMADSDVDGKHIIGLVLNYFHCRFPSLLQRGYVCYLRTPIVKVTLGRGRVEKFYTQASYDEWAKTVGDVSRYKHKYYKGLGTSNDNDIKEEFLNSQPKVVVCLYDEQAPVYFKLAFSQDMSDERKRWIEMFKPALGVENIIQQPISEFLYYELTEYMTSNIVRSIPKLCDGLKESQRKALWVAMSKRFDEIKVNALAAATTEMCGYKHGEQIMATTIAQMAHDFVGSNNMPYFVPQGQLGTRNRGGDDAADPRYTYVSLQPWIQYVFRPEDNDLLDRVVDEGVTVEPVTFYPIIPMCLVNGTIGIGSGYSTFIPSYNPLDIVTWLECRLRGQATPSLMPWYKGFKGSIEIVETTYVDVGQTTTSTQVDVSQTTTDTHVNDNDQDVLGPDQVIVSRMSVVTRGIYRLTKEGIEITELPIRRFTFPYKLWLDQQVQNKVIKSYVNHSTANDVHFIVKGLRSPNYRTLRLERKFGLSNMVLLDNDNRPKRYGRVEDILDDFYHLRLAMYHRRKEAVEKALKNKVERLSTEAKLLDLIRRKEIVVIDRPLDEIKQALQRHNICEDILKHVRLLNCTMEQIQAKLDEVEKAKQELELYSRKTAEDIWLGELDEFRRHYRV